MKRIFAIITIISKYEQKQTNPLMTTNISMYWRRNFTPRMLGIAGQVILKTEGSISYSAYGFSNEIYLRDVNT